jgi:hypothetical protein
MSCQLISGLALPCKNFMPGIRRVYIANFFSGTTAGENVTYTTNATNQITGMTVTTGKFYEFDLTKESGDVQDAIHANQTNGTVAYESNINLYLSQYSTNVRNQITILATAKVLIIAEDRNGQYWLFGTDGTGVAPSTSNGCDMNDSTATPGKAYGADPNGYQLVFNAIEKVPALEVLSSVIPSIVG